MRNNPINPGKLNTRSILRPCVLCIVYVTNEERRGSVTLHVAAEDVKLDFGCDAQPVFELSRPVLTQIHNLTMTSSYSLSDGLA